MKRIAPLLIPLLLACGCDLMQSTKGGVETTNGLSGIIKDQSGNPVAHAQVVLVPEAYNGAEPAISVAPEKTETDADGRYRFNHVVPGPYNLESNLPVRNLKAWLPGLDIGEAQADAPIPDMALKAPGILKIPFADRHLAENALLFIPGTTIAMPIVGKIDSGGDLMVPGLPEGRFPSLMAYFPDTVDGGKLAVCPAFTIHSGDTTSIAGLASWSGRKTIHLDLSGAAGLPEPMEGHPILIRLDAANFNFSEAGAGGKDIRFTDSGGTYLPFQIEQWDDASKQSAIWVKLNTLHRDKDSLIFHWGRKDAVGISNGAAVFDSAQGFAAVWHLGEAGNASPGGYKDATIGGYHATGTTSGGAPGFKAVAGNGKLFQGSGDGLTGSMPATLEGGKSFSVTFWMDFQPNPNRQTILALGEEVTDLGFHFLIRPDTTAQFGAFDFANGSLPSPRQNSFSLSPYVNQWIFVATVYDASQGSLTTYVNGVESATSALSAFAMRASGELKMGAAISDTIQTEAGFSGGLDEVRLYDKAISGESIRWEYSIQRDGSAIVMKP